MKTQHKTSLIILGTFILGLVAGILLAPVILKGPKHKRPFDGRDGFKAKFERIIKPTDAQRAQINQILDQHSEKYLKGRRELMDRIKSRMDSLKLQLDPILDDEQKARLERYFQKRAPRERRRRH